MENDKNNEYTRLLSLEAELDKMLSDGGSRSLRMRLLHEYNTVKDAAQLVINYIANVEGTTISTVHERLELRD